MATLKTIPSDPPAAKPSEACLAFKRVSDAHEQEQRAKQKEREEQREKKREMERIAKQKEREMQRNKEREERKGNKKMEGDDMGDQDLFDYLNDPKYTTH